jgi:hypothetical protein
VRAQIRKTNLKKTLLGIDVRFNAQGDMQRRPFGIWKANAQGVFSPVG